MNHSMQSAVVLNERYRIVRQLGQSSAGCTYLVEDTHRFNELCVVKELSPHLANSEQLQKTEELFEREAKVLYKLQHPQIPRFRELFRLQNRLFLVQDYVQGQTYGDLLKIRQMQSPKQTFSEDEVIELLKNILPVLTYIHARGIIHRDICPNNIILRHSDQLPILIDFGTVKQLATTGVDPVTQQPLTIAIATQLGQMGYAPPEQIQSGLVFPHSDLYALAASVLVLLTGKQPSQILDGSPLTSDWKKDLMMSSKLQELLTKMLSKTLGERPQSAREVLESLKAVESQPLKTGVANKFPSAVAQPTQATLVVVPGACSPSIGSSNVATPATPPSRESVTNPTPATPSGTSSRPQYGTCSVPQPISLTPSSLTPPQLNSVTSSQNNSTMTSTSTRPGNVLNGCLGKFALVMILSIGSGMMGWLAGKTWLEQITQGDQKLNPSNSTTVFADNPSSSGISDQEWKRKNNIQTRRLNLNINNKFFYSLVDQLYNNKYPSQQGKVLTNKPEDEQSREKWDKIALDLLDTLSILSDEARQNLGQYVQPQLNTWKQQVNKLHLSSRALYDLADASFLYYFPEQENQTFIEQPVGQIWYAFVYNKLQDLESGKIYEKLEMAQQQLEIQTRGRLEPGEGKAYVMRLNGSKNFQIQLEADRDTLLSIYSPTGKNNLLEDSRDNQWSGTLPEDGFYEFTIVSKSKKPLDYQLTIREDNSFLKPIDN